MDDEEPKTSKSKSSHGSLARNRESPTEPRNRTLKNLTLFLPKLLKEVGKTAASVLAQGVESARSLRSPSHERTLQCITDVVDEDSNDSDNSSDSKGHITDSPQSTARRRALKKKSLRHRSTSLAEVGRVNINIRMDSPKRRHLPKNNRTSLRKGSSSSSTRRSSNASIGRFKVISVKRRTRSRLVQNNLICNPMLVSASSSFKEKKSRSKEIFRIHSDAEFPYQKIKQDNTDDVFNNEETVDEEHQRRNTIGHKNEHRHRVNSSKKWNNPKNYSKTVIVKENERRSQTNAFEAFERLFLHTSIDDDGSSLLSSSSLSIPPHSLTNSSYNPWPETLNESIQNSKKNDNKMKEEEKKNSKLLLSPSPSPSPPPRLQREIFLQKGSKSSSNINLLSSSVPTNFSYPRTNSLSTLIHEENKSSNGNSSDHKMNSNSGTLTSSHSKTRRIDISKQTRNSEEQTVENSIPRIEFTNASNRKVKHDRLSPKNTNNNNNNNNNNNVHSTSTFTPSLKNSYTTNSGIPQQGKNSTKIMRNDSVKRQSEHDFVSDNQVTTKNTKLVKYQNEEAMHSTNDRTEVDDINTDKGSDVGSQEIKNPRKKRSSSNSSRGSDFYFVGRHTRTKLSVKANSLSPSEWNQYVEGVVEQKETVKVKKLHSPKHSTHLRASPRNWDDSDLSVSHKSTSPRSTDNTQESTKTLTPSSSTSKLKVEDLDNSSSHTATHKPYPIIEML